MTDQGKHPLALEIRVNIAVEPDPPEPTKKASPVDEVVDEEASTNEYRSVVEEKKTSAYNPSVATLLDRFTAPEVAVVASPHLGPIQHAILDVNERLAEIKRTKDTERKRLTAVIEAAQTCVAEATTVLAEAPDTDEVIAEPRTELSDLVLTLQRVVTQRSRVLAKPEPRPDQPTTEPALVEQAEQSYQAGTRRRNVLLVLVLLLGGGRLALLFGSSAPTEHTEFHQDRDGVEAVNHLAGATEAQLAQGIPSVMDVRLTQLPEGDLQARTVAFDPDGDPLQLTYHWISNGKVIEIESSGTLPADRVAAGTTYQVQVSASDGKHESSKVMTQPITVGSKISTGDKS